MVGQVREMAGSLPVLVGEQIVFENGIHVGAKQAQDDRGPETGTVLARGTVKQQGRMILDEQTQQFAEHGCLGDCKMAIDADHQVVRGYVAAESGSGEGVAFELQGRLDRKRMQAPDHAVDPTGIAFAFPVPAQIADDPYPEFTELITAGIGQMAQARAAIKPAAPDGISVTRPDAAEIAYV